MYKYFVFLKACNYWQKHCLTCALGGRIQNTRCWDVTTQALLVLHTTEAALLVLHTTEAQWKPQNANPPLTTLPLTPSASALIDEECPQHPSQQALTQPRCPWKPVCSSTRPQPQLLLLSTDDTVSMFSSVLFRWP